MLEFCKKHNSKLQHSNVIDSIQWTKIHDFKSRLHRENSCLAVTGYQPDYHVMNSVCDWFPALALQIISTGPSSQATP